MTIHSECSKLYNALVREISVRGEMDSATFRVMEESGRDWDFVRRAVDPAMSDQNVRVLEIMAELKRCECPRYERG